MLGANKNYVFGFFGPTQNVSWDNQKLDYVAKVQEILNLTGYQKCTIGSKNTAILLNG